MKVLYFVPEFPKLSETFINREVTKLVEFGHLDLTVFALARGSGKMTPEVEAVTKFERLTVGICIQALFGYIFRHPKKVLRAHGLIRGSDITPYLLQTRREKYDPAADLSVLGRFHRARLVQFFKGIAYAKLFAKYSPDHIHVNFLSDTSTVVMVAAKMLDVPFSLSAHAKDVFVDGSLISVKAKEAKFITVCNGNAYQEVVRQANKVAASGKVHLIYHGFDAAKAYSGEITIPRPNKLAIFMGGTRFTEKKGIEYMLLASKILKDRGIEHQVDLVGFGEDYEKILAQIKELGVQDTVLVHGNNKGTPNETVLQYYRVADVMVFPAIEGRKGDIDGVPTVIIEAAFAKLPIITTNVGSIGDLITEKTGVLIGERDPNAIADAIESLVADKERADMLGEAVCIKAEEMFNLDINVEVLEKLLISS